MKRKTEKKVFPCTSMNLSTCVCSLCYVDFARFQKIGLLVSPAIDVVSLLVEVVHAQFYQSTSRHFLAAGEVVGDNCTDGGDAQRFHAFLLVEIRLIHPEGHVALLFDLG